MSNKKRKIAHVTYSLPVGGVTNVIKQLLHGVSDEAEQLLILLSEKEAIPDDLAGIKVYRLDYSLPEEYTLKGFATIWLQPNKYYAAIVDRLKAIHDEEQFDVYHFHGIPKDLAIGSLLQKKLPALQLVYTDHLMRLTAGEYSGIKTKALAFIYKQFYKSYHVIFVSQAIYTSAASLGFVNKQNKNKVIENSVDLNKVVLKTNYTSGDPIRIVYVSRISAVKGHFILPAVASILLNNYGLKHFQFVLIGPGELTEELKKAVAAKKLDDHFVFEGAKANVPSFLYQYDMAVFPSEREGLPVALLEKMAAGLPVVASDIAEIKNVIHHKEEALLFPVHNAEQCAELLHKLITDQPLREATGAAARRAVEERYSTPLLNKYVDFYKEVMG